MGFEETVSTHSRLEAAERRYCAVLSSCQVSTHSRLEAAEGVLLPSFVGAVVSTHSRLEAAEQGLQGFHYPTHCFNTQPPRGG